MNTMKFPIFFSFKLSLMIILDTACRLASGISLWRRLPNSKAVSWLIYMASLMVVCSSVLATIVLMLL